METPKTEHPKLPPDWFPKNPQTFRVHLYATAGENLEPGDAVEIRIDAAGITTAWKAR